MIHINIDLNVENAPVRAGIVGEHNARELHITPPVELLTADYYRALFGVGTSAIYTERLGELEDGEERGDTVLTVPLVMELTAQNQTTMTLEAYKNDGTYLGKSRLIHLFFESAVGGTPTDVETQPYGIAVEVAENTASRHTHANKELLDAYDGTSTGGGILTVDTVADLSDDAADGTIAMVRYVDRRGTLSCPDEVDYGYRTPLEGILYVNSKISCEMQMVGVTVFLRAAASGHDIIGVYDQYLLSAKDKYAIVLQELVPETELYGVFVLDPNDDFNMLYLYACQDTSLQDVELSEDTWYRYDDGEFIPIIYPKLLGLHSVVAYDADNNRVTSQSHYDWISSVISPYQHNNVLHVKKNGNWEEAT